MRKDIDKLKEQLAPTLALTKAALKDLASGNGKYWKEAVGELQSQYNEIVLWILLYDDVDLLRTHVALRDTLRPHMESLTPLQIVLFYEIVSEGSVSAAKLSGNDAVFSAGADGKIDLNWFPLGHGLSTAFISRDSKRQV